MEYENKNMGISNKIANLNDHRLIAIIVVKNVYGQDGLARAIGDVPDPDPVDCSRVLVFIKKSLHQMDDFSPGIRQANHNDDKPGGGNYFVVQKSFTSYLQVKQGLQVQVLQFAGIGRTSECTQEGEDSGQRAMQIGMLSERFLLKVTGVEQSLTTTRKAYACC
ncbi:hypothetical protein HAX54_028213 [Datura stramonium]|uniref:Uncharacterized protein n=1 Tax=Datura stramonium TaxID=4076 RepID=A0ABS8V3Z7_DATST|nr:hypothetical protein [Datura stramonium]